MVLWTLSRSFFLTLFGKRGIFTRSPIFPQIAGQLYCSIAIICLFVYYTFNTKYTSFPCKHFLNIYKFRSKVLVRRIQCLLAQSHRTLTRSPILLASDSVPLYTQGRHWDKKYIPYCLCIFVSRCYVNLITCG